MDDAAADDVGDDDPVGEEVARAAAVRLSDDAGAEAGLDAEAAVAREVLEESAGGPADAEPGDRLVGEAAGAEVVARGRGEPGVVVRGGGGEDLPDEAGLLHMEDVVVAHAGERDLGAGGEEAEGLHKGDAVAELDEAEDVAPGAAAEAVEVLARGDDVEARGRLGVEGAQGPVRAVEREALGDDGEDVVRVADALDEVAEGGGGGVDVECGRMGGGAGGRRGGRPRRHLTAPTFRGGRP